MVKVVTAFGERDDGLVPNLGAHFTDEDTEFATPAGQPLNAIASDLFAPRNVQYLQIWASVPVVVPIIFELVH